MTTRRALVTGATGFVGSHVAGRLLADGWQVHALVRPASALDRLGVPGAAISVHRIEPDIDSMRGALRDAKPDVVFHLASLFVAEHAPDDVARLVESNLAFGALLLEAMSREGARRLVNAGTSWQHHEGRDYSPVNLYAATKQAFEALLQYYVEACGLAAVTLELFDTYGPGDRRRKLVNLLLDAARTGKPLAASPGDQAIDLVHVEDVAHGFARAGEMLLDERGPGHRRFGVSSGTTITLRALAEQLEQALGVKVPVTWGEREHRAREVMAPVRGMPALPGWRPGISLAEGLRGLK